MLKWLRAYDLYKREIENESVGHVFDEQEVI
jgi:hypothetical protein